MINFKQFEDLTTRVITDMYAYSDPAVRAIMMIVAHESHRGTYLKQIKGPALGVIQMEPDTHTSLWRYADNIHHNAAQLDIVKNVKSLEWDLRYNIFMARSMLLTDINPIPRDDYALSSYLKDFYNTKQGKAGSADYMMAYRYWRNQP